MNKVIKRIAPALLLFLFFGALPVNAADLDLTVSPVSQDYSPIPGEIIKDKVSIHNNSGTPVKLNLTISKLVIDEQGNSVPADIAPNEDMAGWIKFPSDKISAPAREWLDIPYSISIPSTAAYGNYFALVFTPDAAQVSAGTTVIQGKVLVPILLNVKKEGAKAEAGIIDFKVTKFVSEYLPVDFSISVRNLGNVHLKPRGNIFIRSAGQKDLAILEVNPGKSSLLPGSTKSYTAGWSDGFIVKDLNNRLTINWNKLTAFRIGKYSAQAVLVYDDGRRDIPIESTISFWVFPYTAAAFILGIIIFSILTIIYGFKALVKKEARKIQQS